MEDKIIILESLSQSSDQETVNNKIISKLDDSEIEVEVKHSALFSLTKMIYLNF